MTLYSALHVARSSLQATQIGLQVTSNNIANADNPDYVRQTVELSPTTPQQLGPLILGTGVQVEAIRQEIDWFLEERVRRATSELNYHEVRSDTFAEVEGVLVELTDGDLSSSLSDFFARIQDVLNQPEDLNARRLAVLEGEALGEQFRRLDRRAVELSDQLDEQVAATAEDINRLVNEIGELNRRIQDIEVGGASRSDAVGLRDQRYRAMVELSRQLDIQVNENSTGAVNVFVGGEFLVFEGITREVRAEVQDGLTEVRLADSGALLNLGTGRLGGLISARDEIAAPFQQQLDQLAANFIHEFNRVYSSGQGQVGFESLTGQYNVTDPHAALDAAGLEFTPETGTLEVVISDAATGLSRTHSIHIDLDGIDQDTTLFSLARSLDAIPGLSATVTPRGFLQLEAVEPNQSFSFAHDTSGVLAATGLNTFFVGSSAKTLGVHSDVADDPRRFAASGGGVGADSRNAERLAALQDTPLESLGGLSLSQSYEQFVGQVVQQTAVSRALVEGAATFQQTLEAEKLSFSGVNLDEEAVKMIQYQRSFQAAARVISTISEMLDVLVNL